MDWGSRLKAWRDRLTEDPAGVRTEIARALEQDDERPGPTDHVRLYTLLVSANRDLGDSAAGLQALESGQSLHGSAAARADLLAAGASLNAVARRDADAARELIQQALRLVEGELSRPPSRSYSARKRRQGLVDTKATCLIIRSDVALWLEERQTPAAAMADVLEALELTAGGAEVRVRMAAISRLAGVLLHFGSLNGVTRALELVDQADRTLARRRVRRSHLHRILLRWVRALALARLGSVDRAENIMADVIEHLRRKGQVERLKHAVDALAWIVGERAGRPARAEYLRRKLAP